MVGQSRMQGSTRVHGDEVASDYDVKNTALGYAKNLSQGATEAIDGFSSEILDVGADAYASTIRGASEVNTEDEALFRSIETKRELATKKAQLHVDRNAKVNAAKDAAIANLYGDDVADTGASIEEHASNESLEATTDKYLREVLTPERATDVRWIWEGE